MYKFLLTLFKTLYFQILDLFYFIEPTFISLLSNHVYTTILLVKQANLRSNNTKLVRRLQTLLSIINSIKFTASTTI